MKYLHLRFSSVVVVSLATFGLLAPPVKATTSSTVVSPASAQAAGNTSPISAEFSAAPDARAAMRASTEDRVLYYLGRQTAPVLQAFTRPSNLHHPRVTPQPRDEMNSFTESNLRAGALSTAGAYAAIAIEPGLTPTGPSTGNVEPSLNGANFAPAIAAATIANRELIAADIEARLTVTTKALESLRATTAEMSPARRTQFQSADADLRNKEGALRQSLKAASTAGAQEWEAARAQLATDFQAHAQAVANLAS